MRIDIKGDIVDDDMLEFYEWWGAPATAPKSVLAALNQAAEGEEIDVYINSPGGSVFAGAEIYSELRQRNVTVHITGLAASAASVIACAGRRTLISPAGCMMIHNVQTWAKGDYRDMQKMADTLKKVNQTISTAYTEKTGKEEKELLRLMDAETWMPAAVCVEQGFCDGVEERRQEKENKTLRPAAGFGTTLSEEQIERARREIAAAKAKPAVAEEKKKAAAKLRLLNLRRTSK